MTKKPCVDGRGAVAVQRDLQVRADPRAEPAAGADARPPVVELLVVAGQSARSRRAPRAGASGPGDTRQVNVASGKPPLVAVPVVLHGFQSPTQTSRLICAGAGCCRAGGRGRWRRSGRRAAAARPAAGPAGQRAASGDGDGAQRQGEPAVGGDAHPPACRTAGTVDGFGRSAACSPACRRPAAPTEVVLEVVDRQVPSPRRVDWPGWCRERRRRRTAALEALAATPSATPRSPGSPGCGSASRPATTSTVVEQLPTATRPPPSARRRSSPRPTAGR